MTFASNNKIQLSAIYIHLKKIRSKKNKPNRNENNALYSVWFIQYEMQIDSLAKRISFSWGGKNCGFTYKIRIEIALCLLYIWIGTMVRESAHSWFQRTGIILISTKKKKPMLCVHVTQWTLSRSNFMWFHSIYLVKYHQLDGSHPFNFIHNDDEKKITRQ